MDTAGCRVHRTTANKSAGKERMRQAHFASLYSSTHNSRNGERIAVCGFSCPIGATTHSSNSNSACQLLFIFVAIGVGGSADLGPAQMICCSEKTGDFGAAQRGRPINEGVMDEWVDSKSNWRRVAEPERGVESWVRP